MQVALKAGDVKRSVPSVVHQRGITAGHQEAVTHLWLVCYYCQVERSLRRDRQGGLLSQQEFSLI